MGRRTSYTLAALVGVGAVLVALLTLRVHPLGSTPVADSASACPTAGLRPLGCDRASPPGASTGIGPQVGPSASAGRSTAAGGSAAPSGPAPAAGRTAAQRYGWSKLVAQDDFSGTSLSSKWRAYDSPGNAGKGIRSPKQISVGGGLLTMTGAPDGTTGGMSWRGSQKYGRWEVRARFPAGCVCYHPVLLLWPTEVEWPAGGEVDYAEVSDAGRQRLKFYLHYGADNNHVRAYHYVDMTKWHYFAVEWSADHITAYIDGEPFFHTTQRSILPPGAMHQTIQLDWFPDANDRTGATMEVDWVRIYGL